jgi:hypothetical protein
MHFLGTTFGAIYSQQSYAKPQEPNAFQLGKEGAVSWQKPETISSSPQRAAFDPDRGDSNVVPQLVLRCRTISCNACLYKFDKHWSQPPKMSQGC